MENNHYNMETSGRRKFHGDFSYTNNADNDNSASSREMFDYIKDGIIGKHLTFNGAFGNRKGIYLQTCKLGQK